jgi:multiple sugar transport system substrate-binding protein
LNLSLTYDIPEIETNAVENLLKKNVCGLILVTCQPDNWQYYYNHFTSKDRPLVLIDRLIHNLDSIFVTFDNNRSIYRVIQAFLKEGKQDIYLLAGPESYFCELECILGYIGAFTDAGLEPDVKKIVTASLNKEEAFRQTVRIMKNNRPNAIVTTSEHSAMGIIECLLLLGYNPPEVIPVITLGEEHWNRYTHSMASISTERPRHNWGKGRRAFGNQIRSQKHLKNSIYVNGSRPALYLRDDKRMPAAPNANPPAHGGYAAGQCHRGPAAAF